MATKPEQINHQRALVNVDGPAIKKATHRYARRIERTAIRNGNYDAIPSRMTKGWAA